MLKVLKETENENQPWMMCIPLPRVMQILYQTSFLKVDNPQNYADLLPGISFFCSGSSSDLQKYLSTLLRFEKYSLLSVLMHIFSFIPFHTMANLH